MKDGFGETFVAYYMPKLYTFPSLDRCQKRFLWTHTEVDLAPHPVVGLVLQEGDAEKFSQALGFENLDPFLRVIKQGLMVLHRLILFSLAIAAIAEVILTRISTEQVRFLHRPVYSRVFETSHLL